LANIGIIITTAHLMILPGCVYVLISDLDNSLFWQNSLV